MIIRTFRVLVPAKLTAEFEAQFKTVSLTAVANAPGCVSVKLGAPVQDASNEYLMISEWQDLDALIRFAGEQWRQPHIPEGMEKFVLDCWVHHHEELT